MSFPQTHLPIRGYMHPTTLHGMASVHVHTPSQRLDPVRDASAREKMRDDIQLRAAEVRRRIESMGRDDEEIGGFGGEGGGVERRGRE
ncbi:hypothetical protein ST47_g396 [Ascochyta rabiei]|uniref:Uncharacterized protein n=1 Tax=Didymella rabiei TaxID=5454 RepID=A0A163M6T0_DIDRA|nr:hypothetical protein ST47_g396 [Ascochyta rabiei]